jgi:hypothetical protein
MGREERGGDRRVEQTIEVNVIKGDAVKRSSSKGNDSDDKIRDVDGIMWGVSGMSTV